MSLLAFTGLATLGLSIPFAYKLGYAAAQARAIIDHIRQEPTP